MQLIYYRRGDVYKRITHTHNLQRQPFQKNKEDVMHGISFQLCNAVPVEPVPDDSNCINNWIINFKVTFYQTQTESIIK